MVHNSTNLGIIHIIFNLDVVLDVKIALCAMNASYLLPTSLTLFIIAFPFIR